MPYNTEKKKLCQSAKLVSTPALGAPKHIREHNITSEIKGEWYDNAKWIKMEQHTPLL